MGFRHWECTTKFLFNKIKKEGGARAVKGFDKLSNEDKNMVLKACKEPLNPVETKDESPSPTPSPTTPMESTAGTSKAGSSRAESVSGVKAQTQKRKRGEKALDVVELSVSEEDLEEEKPKKKKKKRVAGKK